MQFIKSKVLVSLDPNTGFKEYATDVTCIVEYKELDYTTFTNKNVAHAKFLFGTENQLVTILLNKQFYTNINIKVISGMLLEFCKTDKEEWLLPVDAEYILNNTKLIDFGRLEDKLLNK